MIVEAQAELWPPPPTHPNSFLAPCGPVDKDWQNIKWTTRSLQKQQLVITLSLVTQGEFLF